MDHKMHRLNPPFVGWMGLAPIFLPILAPAAGSHTVFPEDDSLILRWHGIFMRKDYHPLGMATKYMFFKKKGEGQSLKASDSTDLLVVGPS